MFGACIGAGWPSPSIPQLLSDNTTIPITRDEASWLVSIFLVGMFTAPIPAAYIMDRFESTLYKLQHIPHDSFLINCCRFGRKPVFLLAAIPSIVGWLLIALANSFAMLLSARLLIGFCLGLMYVAMPIYFAEIASTKIRGSVSMLVTVSIRCGILFAYVVGQYLSISLVAWTALVFPFAFLLLFMRCPESPYYLLDAQDPTAAHHSLVQLRGHADVQSELDQMQIVVDSNQRNRPSFLELIAPQNRRSLLILVALIIVAIFSSANSIMAYAEMIFGHIGSDFPAGYSSIILGCVELTASVCGSIFIDKFGRRRILFVSLTVSFICNGILTIYFSLRRWYDVSWWAWFPIVIIMIGNGFTSFGMMPMSVVILGEIFPKHLKGIGGITLVTCNGLGSCLAFKIFLIVVDSLGYDVMFGVFMIICLAVAPFLWHILPETKEKSFQVILDEIRAKSLR